MNLTRPKACLKALAFVNHKDDPLIELHHDKELGLILDQWNQECG